MAKDTPLTKEELVSELAEFYVDLVKPDMKKIVKKIDGVEKELVELKAEVVGNSRRIDDLKTDIADTPSRKEFNQLKTKVDRYHPTN